MSVYVCVRVCMCARAHAEAARLALTRNCMSSHSFHPPTFGCCQAFRTAFEVAAWRTSCEAAASGMKSTLKAYRCAAHAMWCCFVNAAVL